MDYVRQKPGIRMRQLLVSALEHHEAVARSQWGKEAGAAGIGQKERAFVRAARARVGKAKAEWRRRKQQPLPVDLHAGLPSLAARARAVGAFPVSSCLPDGITGGRPFWTPSTVRAARATPSR